VLDDLPGGTGSETLSPGTAKHLPILAVGLEVVIALPKILINLISTQQQFFAYLR
jgi:hypothetical protein